MNNPDYGIILVTASSQEEAEKIAYALIERGLAACINIFPIRSIYTWQGNINSDAEWQLTIKTDLTYFPILESTIKELHSYTTPEIIAIPIVNGSQTYLQWISANVQPN